MSHFAFEVAALAGALQARRAMLATAESCTGGMIAAACTDRAGSSEWFERGFVTYSDAAKTQMLGVEPGRIAAHGAVSVEVAGAMAEGALVHSEATWAVAVTGIAGPAGATPGKPVGTVCLSVAAADGERIDRDVFIPGDRDAVRDHTTTIVLHLLRRLLTGPRAPAA